MRRPSATTLRIGGNKGSCSAELITRDLFPPGGAGDYTYKKSLQAYGAQIPLPRAAQDLPPDRFHHLLDTTVVDRKIRREQGVSTPCKRAKFQGL